MAEVEELVVGEDVDVSLADLRPSIYDRTTVLDESQVPDGMEMVTDEAGDVHLQGTAPEEAGDEFDVTVAHTHKNSMAMVDFTTYDDFKDQVVDVEGDEIHVPVEGGDETGMVTILMQNNDGEKLPFSDENMTGDGFAVPAAGTVYISAQSHTTELGDPYIAEEMYQTCFEVCLRVLDANPNIPDFLNMHPYRLWVTSGEVRLIHGGNIIATRPYDLTTGDLHSMMVYRFLDGAQAKARILMDGVVWFDEVQMPPLNVSRPPIIQAFIQAPAFEGGSGMIVRSVSVYRGDVPESYNTLLARQLETGVARLKQSITWRVVDPPEEEEDTVPVTSASTTSTTSTPSPKSTPTVSAKVYDGPTSVGAIIGYVVAAALALSLFTISVLYRAQLVRQVATPKVSPGLRGVSK